MSVPTRRLEGAVRRPAGATIVKVVLAPVSVDLGGVVTELPFIKDLAGNTLVLGPVPVDADADTGAWGIDLIVTDSPETDPTGFGWQASVFADGARVAGPVVFEVPTAVGPLLFNDVVTAREGTLYGSLVTWADFDALTAEVTTAADGAVTARIAAETAQAGAVDAQAASEGASLNASQAAAASSAAAQSALTARDGAVAAEQAAQVAQVAATLAKQQAETMRGDASVSAADAQTAADAAEAARVAAAAARDAATAARDAAQAASLAASDASDAAQLAAAESTQSRDAAVTARSGAETAAADAGAAKIDTVAARDAAAGSQIAAGSSADAAQSSAAAAETARVGAVAAQDTAVGARDAAATARTGAETAKSGADTAKIAAETARDASVVARTAAETAKSGAETARDASVAARTAAETARDAALQAKAGAETAKSAAETARTGAETARTGAEAAKAANETAMNAHKASGDHDGRYFTRDQVLSRGTGLVTNGTGFLGNNTGFSLLTPDFVDVPAGAVCAFRTDLGQYLSVTADDYLPVDPNKTYRFSYSAKQLNPACPDTAGYHYSTVSCYDVDKSLVAPETTMFQAGSLTTLAVDLKPGDTTVTLTSAAGWAFANTTGAQHQRGIIFWDWVNTRGYAWPPETYSRHVWHNLFAQNAIDLATGVITLSAPWPASRGTMPAGTKVSASDGGGTFKYIAAANVVIPKTWTPYYGEIGGVDRTGRNLPDRFHPATAYVKIGWLLNRQSTPTPEPLSQHSVALASLSEVAAAAPIANPDFVTLTASGYTLPSKAAVLRILMDRNIQFYPSTQGSSAANAREVLVLLKQDAVGGRTVDWNLVGNFRFANGVRPVLTMKPNAVDVLRFTVLPHTSSTAADQQTYPIYLVEVVAQDINSATPAVAAVGPTHRLGTGTPEGVLTAPVGSTYTDQAATNGAIRWFKESGTGATGWQVEVGDTGHRYMAASLNAPWKQVSSTWGPFLVRRGRLVIFEGYINPDTKTSTQIITLPVGFRPRRRAFGTYVGVGVTSPMTVNAQQDGVLDCPYLNYAGAPSSGFVHVEFLTDDAWPTVLPGTPA